jgi:hypothetical protein
MQCPKCGTEKTNDAQVCQSCGYAFEKNTTEKPAQKPKVSQLATFSFALSFLSVFLFYLAAIPSVLLAIISIVKINKSGDKLKGKAFAVAAIIISILLMSAIFLWSFDAPPIPNDYTLTDIHSAPPEYAESFKLLIVFNKEEPNTPLESSIGLSEKDTTLIRQIINAIDEGNSLEISETLKNNNDAVEKVWIKAEKARSIINKLNTFDEIADLTELNLNSDTTNMLNMVTLAHLYRAYTYLQLEQKNTKIPIDDLVAFDSAIRKLSLNARCPTTKMTCLICLADDIQTANAVINNSQTSQHILEQLQNTLPHSQKILSLFEIHYFLNTS